MNIFNDNKLFILAYGVSDPYMQSTYVFVSKNKCVIVQQPFHVARYIVITYSYESTSRYRLLLTGIIVADEGEWELLFRIHDDKASPIQCQLP